MIDVPALLIEWLNTSNKLDSLIDGRIYGVRLPVDLVGSPTIKKTVVLACRGGRGNPFATNLIQPSVQFSCYGETSVEAWKVYRALHDFLWPKQNLWVGEAWLQWSHEEVGAQDVVDQRGNWPFVLTFWRFEFRNDVP